MPVCAGTCLQVRVSAVSVGGTGNASDVLEVVTMAGVPVAGLIDGAEEVTVDSRTPDTLLITWRIPQVHTKISWIC